MPYKAKQIFQASKNIKVETCLRKSKNVQYLKKESNRWQKNAI